MGTVFGDALAARLAPWRTPDLTTYCRALGQMFEQVTELVRDQGTDGEPGFVPGYGILFDPDLCPAQWLPYLAQYVGVIIPQGASEPTARGMIKAEQGMQRGKPDVMIAAAKRWLAGSQFVLFIERRDATGAPDAYQCVMGLHPGEILDMGLLQAAVNAVKPGGIRVNYVSSDGYTWNEAAHTWAAEGSLTWVQSFSTQP